MKAIFRGRRPRLALERETTLKPESMVEIDSKPMLSLRVDDIAGAFAEWRWRRVASPVKIVSSEGVAIRRIAGLLAQPAWRRSTACSGR